MTLISWRNRLNSPKSPYWICLFGVSFFFVVGSLFPYYTTDDMGLLLKSAQQFAQGETPFLHFLTLPRIEDLAQDVNTWITWYPPGVTLVFYPFIQLVNSVGVGAKLTSFVLFCCGAIGWLRLGKELKLPHPALLIYACLLPIYTLNIGGASEIINGEILPFAIIPWLLQFLLRIIADIKTPKLNKSRYLSHYHFIRSSRTFIISIYSFIYALYLF